MAASVGAAFCVALLFAQSSSRVEGPLSLAKALEIAARNNPEAIGAAADLAAAKQATRSAQAKRLPAISANGFASSGSYGAIFPSTPRVDPFYNLAAPSGGFLDANVMLMLPLLTGGLLDSMVGSARGLESAAGFDLAEAKADAALSAEDSYLRALLASENMVAAEARMQANEDLVKTTRSQFEAGKGIEASVHRAESELAQAQRAHTSAQGEREKALLDLESSLGLDLDSPITLSDSLSDPGPAEALDVYLAMANKGRAALLASRARLRSAEAEVGAAQGARRPQLYGVAMADGASRSEAQGASVGLVLSVPLFDGGERRAEVARAQAMRDRAAANLRKAELDVQREVRQAFVDRATADVNVKSAEASVTSAKDAYDVAALRVANGKSILVEQFDALQALTRARADLAQARYDRQIADARLRRAAGLPLLKEASK